MSPCSTFLAGWEILILIFSAWYAENQPFHTYFIQHFSQTRPFTAISQHPWNPSKAEQSWNFCKTFIPRGYSIWLCTLLNKKQHLYLLSITIYWTLASGYLKFSLTLLVTFRIVFFIKVSLQEKDTKYFHLS